MATSIRDNKGKSEFSDLLNQSGADVQTRKKAAEQQKKEPVKSGFSSDLDEAASELKKKDGGTGSNTPAPTSGNKSAGDYSEFTDLHKFTPPEVKTPPPSPKKTFYGNILQKVGYVKPQIGADPVLPQDLYKGQQKTPIGVTVPVTQTAEQVQEEIFKDPNKVAKLNKDVSDYYDKEIAAETSLNDTKIPLMAGMTALPMKVSDKGKQLIEEKAKALNTIRTDLGMKIAGTIPVVSLAKDVRGVPDLQTEVVKMGKIGTEMMKYLSTNDYDILRTGVAPSKKKDAQLVGAEARLNFIGSELNKKAAAIAQDPEKAKAFQLYMDGKATPAQRNLLDFDTQNLIDEFNLIPKVYNEIEHANPEVRKGTLKKAIFNQLSNQFGTNQGFLGMEGWNAEQLNAVITDYKKKLTDPRDIQILDQISKEKELGTLTGNNQSWAMKGTKAFADVFIQTGKFLKNTALRGAMVPNATEIWEQHLESLHQADRDKTTVTSTFKPDKKTFFLNEYVDPDPNSNNFLKTVKNQGEMDGSLLDKVFYSAASGAGQLAGQVAMAALIPELHAGKAAEFISKVGIPAFTMSYNNNYKQSFDVVGVNEPWKNLLYSTLTSSYEGATELLGNPLAQSRFLASGFKKEIGAFVKDLSLEGLQKMGKTEFKEKLKNIGLEALKGVGRGAVEASGEANEEYVNEWASGLTQMVFNPDYTNISKISDQANQTWVETFASMAFMPGAGVVKGIKSGLGNKNGQDAITFLAQNRSDAIDNIYESLNVGELSQEEANQKIHLVNVAGMAYDQTNKAATLNELLSGKRISKADHAFVTMARANEIQLDNQIKESQANGDTAHVSMLEAIKKDYVSMREAVLSSQMFIDPVTGIPAVPQVPPSPAPQPSAEESPQAAPAPLTEDEKKDWNELSLEEKRKLAIANLPAEEVENLEEAEIARIADENAKYLLAKMRGQDISRTVELKPETTVVKPDVEQVSDNRVPPSPLGQQEKKDWAALSLEDKRKLAIANLPAEETENKEEQEISAIADENAKYLLARMRGENISRPVNLPIEKEKPPVQHNVAEAKAVPKVSKVKAINPDHAKTFETLKDDINDNWLEPQNARLRKLFDQVPFADFQKEYDAVKDEYFKKIGEAAKIAATPKAEKLITENQQTTSTKPPTVENNPTELWRITRSEYEATPGFKKYYGKLEGDNKNAALSVHTVEVEDAIKEGYFEVAIKDNTLTPEKVKDIIESAGLEIPKEILNVSSSIKNTQNERLQERQSSKEGEPEGERSSGDKGDGTSADITGDDNNQSGNKKGLKGDGAGADSVPAPKTIGATNPLQKIVEDYDNSEKDTFDDFVNNIEEYAIENDISELLQAVEDYRKDQEDDRRLKGRGDMDQAETRFMTAVVQYDISSNQNTGNEKDNEAPDLKAIEDQAADAEAKGEDAKTEGDKQAVIAAADAVIDAVDTILAGTPEQQARTKGEKVVNGTVVKRQNVVPAALGKPVEILFSKTEKQPGKYAVIDLPYLQPSHKSGVVNEKHFIPEAQPRDRGGLKVLQNEAKAKADNLDPNQLADNNIAYFGSPIVNARGEVIQGNGRAEAIDYYYNNNSDDTKGYRKMVLAKAAELGISPAEVEAMQNPVLVRMVDVSDEEAILLGNHTSSELEDVKQKNADVKAALGKVKQSDLIALSGLVSSRIGDENTLKGAIRENAKAILDLLMNAGILRVDNREQYLSQEGVTPEGIEAAYNIVRELLFEGGANDLPGKFDNLPQLQREAIEKTIPAILGNRELKEHIQKAIEILHEKNESGIPSFGTWERQMDMFKGGQTPIDTYGREDLALAKKLDQAKNQKEIATTIKAMAEDMSGAPASLFDPEKPPMPFKDALIKNGILTEKQTEKQNEPTPTEVKYNVGDYVGFSTPSVVYENGQPKTIQSKLRGKVIEIKSNGDLYLRVAERGYFTIKQSEVLTEPVIQPEQKPKSEKPKVEYAHPILKNLSDLYDAATDDFNRDRVARELAVSLSGDSNKKLRQEIMTALTGVKTPISKSGMSAIEEQFEKWISENKTVQPKQETAPPPTKHQIRKQHINEKLKKTKGDIDDAWKDFEKGDNLLTSGGLDPKKIEAGTKLIGLYIKAGVYKFIDIATDAYERYGEKLKDLFTELKAVYSAYYNTQASDEEAEQMDANIRSVTFDDIKNDNDVSDQSGSSESNRGNSNNALSGNEKTVSGKRKTGRKDRNTNAQGDSTESGEPSGEINGSVFSPAIGEPGDQQLPPPVTGLQSEDGNAGVVDGRGNSVDGTTGLPADQTRNNDADKNAAASAGNFAERTAARLVLQKEANARGIPVKLMDRDNISESVPFLFPEQQDDVFKAEKRFYGENPGKGMMFTNGTGTGKTFTGLGIAKRMVDRGKRNILIVTPSQEKVNDWANDGKNLGLNIVPIENTKDGGKEQAVTTFATFRQNEELLKRDWDMIIYDESHRIMESNKGESSNTTLLHYEMSNKNPDTAFYRISSVHPTWKKYKEVSQLYREANASLNDDTALNPEQTQKDVEKYRKQLEDLDAQKELLTPSLRARAERAAANTKTVFLSATPFKMHFNLRYANGYLFDWGGETITNDRGSRVDPESRFYLENFGSAYEWKYHRLQTKTDALPEAIAMQEIEFSEKLMKQGSLSGRAIVSDKDYSREFPIVAGSGSNTFNSELFNRGFGSIYEYEKNEFSDLRDAAHKIFFNYNYTTQLFEALKTSMAIKRIRQHLDLGRKVVLFHRRRQANVSPPFARILDQTFVNATAKKAEGLATAALYGQTDAIPKINEEYDKTIEQIEKFKERFAELLEYEQTLNYSSAVDQIKNAFPDTAVFVNGDVTKKNKSKSIKDFNTDGSEKDIILVQEESGKEGISLHDTSGQHQRVIISLSMPNSTITALQIEGRIFRLGQESDAIFEYLLLGLDLETAYFGQNFNKKLSTTENLAVGGAARDLIRSFAEGVLFNAHTDAPNTEQGKGGKGFDKMEASVTTEYQKARLVYSTNQTMRGKRDQRAGVDYFATPEPLGQKMMEWAMLSSGDHVLEPSAGHGAIAMWAPTSAALTAIEPAFDLYSKLSGRAGGSSKKVLNQRFEDFNLINKFSAVVMNPPFGSGGKTAIDHIEKAFRHLSDGGRIIALIPNGPAMDKRIDSFLYGKNEKGIQNNPSAYLRKTIILPNVTFQQAGTAVNTKVLIIDKVSDIKNAENPEMIGQQSVNDLSYVDNINDFFDNLEDVGAPGRIRMKESKQTSVSLSDLTKSRDAVIPSTTEAKPEEQPQVLRVNPVTEYTHTKTGETLYFAKPAIKLENDFKTLLRVAKRNAGYYARFVHGFLFPKKADAEKFVREANQETLSDADVSNGALQGGKGEIKDYIATAKSVLSMLYPNASLEVFTDSREYKQAGGIPDTRGTAKMNKNGQHRILLNLPVIAETNSSKTAFHEVIHPIVYDVFGTDSAKLAPIWNQLSATMQRVPGMERVYDHVAQYSVDKMPAEGITEFLTQVAAGNIDITDVPKSTVNKIIDLVNRLFSALGINFQISSVKDFAQIAADIKDAFDGTSDAIKEALKGKSNIDDFITAQERILADADKPRIRVVVGRNDTEEAANDLLDRLVTNIVGADEIQYYLSGDTTRKYTGEDPTNPQEYITTNMQKAFDEGENIINQAKQIYGPRDYVPRLLAYLRTTKKSQAAKSLLFVSLANDLHVQKVNDSSRYEEITKLQYAVNTARQEFLHDTSVALRLSQLQNLLLYGNNPAFIGDRLLSPNEIEQKTDLEESVQVNDDVVNAEQDAIDAANDELLAQLEAEEARIIEEEKAKAAEEEKNKRTKTPKDQWKSTAAGSKNLNDKLQAIRDKMNKLNCK